MEWGEYLRFIPDFESRCCKNSWHPEISAISTHYPIKISVLQVVDVRKNVSKFRR